MNNFSDPIGGGGGLPEPKNPRKHKRLLFLNYRQTYALMNAVPVIELGICFLCFLLALTNIYTISYVYIIQIAGFSILTNIRQWYTSHLIGSCGATYISIYALFILNVINIFHLAFDFNYYEIYGIVITGIGFAASLLFYKK